MIGMFRCTVWLRKMTVREKKKSSMFLHSWLGGFVQWPSKCSGGLTGPQDINMWILTSEGHAVWQLREHPPNCQGSCAYDNYFSGDALPSRGDSGLPTESDRIRWLAEENQVRGRTKWPHVDTTLWLLVAGSECGKAYGSLCSEDDWRMFVHLVF